MRIKPPTSLGWKVKVTIKKKGMVPGINTICINQEGIRGKNRDGKMWSGRKRYGTAREREPRSIRVQWGASLPRPRFPARLRLIDGLCSRRLPSRRTAPRGVDLFPFPTVPLRTICPVVPAPSRRPRTASTIPHLSRTSYAGTRIAVVIIIEYTTLSCFPII